MASGSSGRATAGSKGYDFGTDDILCSYDDFNNQESSNGALSDSGIGSNSGKDFHKSRMSRSSQFPGPVYGQQNESVSQEVIASVERSMKKHTENIVRFLEGISSRLSQLELYCYNLDKSIGEMRSDLGRDHGEADTKLKSLEKHLQEVHRSVQILRDKQELAETQKELAKIQLAQESSSSIRPLSKEERPPSSDKKKTDNTPDTHGQQLALALPHQVAPPQQPMLPSPQTPPQNLPPQPQSCYFPPTNTQHPQNQYILSDPRYQTPQVQDLSRAAPQPAPSQVNPTPPSQAVPQYQQQWAQQLPPRQVQPAPQTSIPHQMQPQSPSVYPSYVQPQPTNGPMPESHPSSRPMQIPFPGVPQAGPGGADAMPYGYGGAGMTSQPQQQPPPQQHKGAYGPQPTDGYGSAGPHPSYPPSSGYMVYDSEGGRPQHPHHQPQFPQGGYPPTNPFPNQPSGPNRLAQNHPYSELIEKLASMGFRGDHVASVIQRKEERGEPIDFNSLLDRLNVHSSGGSQRGWSR